MSFLWPTLLLLLLLVPLGAAAYLSMERRRRARIAGYGTLAVQAGGPDPRTTSRFRRRIPAACLLLGLFLVVIAIARPQAVVSVPRVEGTVMLVFDVSGSMAADDLAPTRMEAAKAAARAFVARQPPTVRIGVVAFSDSGFSVQVPTDDSTQVTAAIDRLAPERGTSIARGILTALTTIAADEAGPAAGFYTNRSPGPTPEVTPVPAGTLSSAVVVLLTDGENNQNPDPLAAALAAADRGVRIYTVGIGTAAGATIEIEGFRVHSQLDEGVLRQIADASHGAYYAVADPAAFDAVYQAVETRLVIRPEPMEVTSLFAGAGLLVLLVGGVASLVVLGRAP
jgi:Ca-activated chloride channel family protein